MIRFCDLREAYWLDADGTYLDRMLGLIPENL